MKNEPKTLDGPEVLKDRLLAKYGADLRRAHQLQKVADACDGDVTVETLRAAKAALACSKTLEDARKAEIESYQECIDVINQSLKLSRDALEAARAGIMADITVLLRAKEQDGEVAEMVDDQLGIRAYLQAHQEYSISDETALPRSVLKPDMALIRREGRKAIKNNEMPDIPGVVFSEPRKARVS